MEPSAEGEEISLRIERVGAAPSDEEGAVRVLLQTTRGDIAGVLTAVEGGTGAVVCVGGARGGVEGPAGGMFGRLAAMLAARGVTTLRVDYRLPNNFQECVADTLAGASFLRGIGAAAIALVGHSFGGAVVIRAGELSPAVVAVASLSPQLYGTSTVEQLRRPLLLVHGAADTILSSEASEDIYRRASEPCQFVLYEGVGHGLAEQAEAIEALLAGWLVDRLAGVPMVSGRTEVAAVA
jgi:alpha/beta superfamily hydrolase